MRGIKENWCDQGELPHADEQAGPADHPVRVGLELAVPQDEEPGEREQYACEVGKYDRSGKLCLSVAHVPVDVALVFPERAAEAVLNELVLLSDRHVVEALILPLLLLSFDAVGLTSFRLHHGLDILAQLLIGKVAMCHDDRNRCH